MTKFTLAAIAVVTLTAVSALPTFAQTQPSNNQPGGPSNNPAPTSTVSCGSELGYLKRVFPADVAGIGDRTRVWVTEICVGSSLMRSEGNAEYVRKSIAKNDVLADALRGRSYTADDVFAVRMMGEDTVNLYVHRFVR